MIRCRKGGSRLFTIRTNGAYDRRHTTAHQGSRGPDLRSGPDRLVTQGSVTDYVPFRERDLINLLSVTTLSKNMDNGYLNDPPILSRPPRTTGRTMVHLFVTGTILVVSHSVLKPYRLYSDSRTWVRSFLRESLVLHISLLKFLYIDFVNP